jgi:sulfotransferase
MKTQDYFFLCGLPRSGSTLLGSLLNQNKDIGVYPNSILPDIINELNKLKFHPIVQNFPNVQPIQNILNDIFYNYFKDSKKKYIIDRGPWGTPDNLKYLKQIIKKPKFIILTKSVLDSLADFINIEKSINIEKRCEELINSNGMIGINLWSINNLIREKENYLFIWYEDFVKKPKQTIKKICKFLDIPYFNVKTENFEQYSIDGKKYDDSVLNKNWHKIDTKKITLSNLKVEDVLPPSIINRYRNITISENIK